MIQLHFPLYIPFFSKISVDNTWWKLRKARYWNGMISLLYNLFIFTKQQQFYMVLTKKKFWFVSKYEFGNVGQWWWNIYSVYARSCHIFSLELKSMQLEVETCSECSIVSSQSRHDQSGTFLEAESAFFDICRKLWKWVWPRTVMLNSQVTFHASSATCVQAVLHMMNVLLSVLYTWARNDFREDFFTAGYCDSTHGMTVSKFLLRLT